MVDHTMIRVFACSHHLIAIQGVRSLIENTQRRLQWLGNEPPYDHILEVIERKKPQVIIADPTLLNWDFELPKKLHEMRVGLLLLIPHKDLVQQEALLRAGAKAVITWSETPGTFIGAVEQVAQLKPWFSPELGVRLMRRAIGGALEPDLSHHEIKISSLTARERFIIMTLIKHPDATTKQLAEQLCLSASTVRNYLSDIYRKLTLKGKSALISFAHEHNLATPML